MEITENRVRFDVVEELALEISEIQVCFDAVLWKSDEIQIRNHLKGIAFSVKKLMLTCHHLEGAACLVKFKITISEIDTADEAILIKEVIAVDEAILDDAANEAIVAIEADDSDNEAIVIYFLFMLLILYSLTKYSTIFAEVKEYYGITAPG